MSTNFSIRVRLLNGEDTRIEISPKIVTNEDLYELISKTVPQLNNRSFYILCAGQHITNNDSPLDKVNLYDYGIVQAIFKKSEEDGSQARDSPSRARARETEARRESETRRKSEARRKALDELTDLERSLTRVRARITSLHTELGNAMDQEEELVKLLKRALRTPPI